MWELIGTVTWVNTNTLTWELIGTVMWVYTKKPTWELNRYRRTGPDLTRPDQTPFKSFNTLEYTNTLLYTIVHYDMGIVFFCPRANLPGFFC